MHRQLSLIFTLVALGGLQGLCKTGSLVPAESNAFEGGTDVLPYRQVVVSDMVVISNLTLGSVSLADSNGVAIQTISGAGGGGVAFTPSESRGELVSDGPPGSLPV